MGFPMDIYSESPARNFFNRRSLNDDKFGVNRE
uniref:Uncharacterized protein n=1 Tax=Anguilla anguilla TaxID=7936 RepID=A0A0E9V4C6_ANGAN